MKIKEKTVSLSQKAKEKIIQYIENENLQADSMLPSEAALTEMLGVSRYTIREALALLEQDRILYKIQGKGTFINKIPTHIESGLEKLESITEIIESFGYDPGTTWIDIEEKPPTEDMIDKMSLNEDDKVVTFRRIRTANGKIAVYCVDTIKRPSSMEEIPHKIDDESMLNYFKDKYGIEPEYAIAEIIPTLPTAEMIKHTKIKKNQLFLLLNQVHYDKQGNPQIYSMDYFSMDVFKFKVNRLR